MFQVTLATFSTLVAHERPLVLASYICPVAVALHTFACYGCAEISYEDDLKRHPVDTYIYIVTLNKTVFI